MVFKEPFLCKAKQQINFLLFIKTSYDLDNLTDDCFYKHVNFINFVFVPSNFLSKSSDTPL